MALADALELKVAGREDPLLRVQKQLENKEILLLLDSFEYLLPGDEGPTAQPQVDGIEFVTQLLSASSDLKILVTSREPLQMSAEWRLDLSG
ncbi:hypothetical protein KFU94_18795 [Chloroflexi bacterium TSY]|nr:hypothetical protein [Chloroflexi bacterium TSY]